MSRLSPIAALHLLSFIVLMSLTSCNDDSCYDNGSSLPLAEFYVNDASATIPGITVMGIGAPGDSLLADSSSINKIYLPLRASVNTTSFVVKRWASPDGEKKLFIDTLTFEYEAVEYFQSAECGAMFNFDIKRLACTENAIDSVKLLTPLITNKSIPALRIYFTDY